jgi:hypothetical protein
LGFLSLRKENVPLARSLIEVVPGTWEMRKYSLPLGAAVLLTMTWNSTAGTPMLELQLNWASSNPSGTDSFT